MNSGTDYALDLFNSPFRDAASLEQWGRTLVVAPHPDDESLGCGGALALLAEAKLPIEVVFISDGAGSHPNSVRWAPPKLANLRESEARNALDILGVGGECARFLRLPDGTLPQPCEPPFKNALGLICSVCEAFQPDTVLVPWRRDPHGDHRASWQLFAHALSDWDGQWLEYLVWGYERSAPHEWPQADEARAFRLDISSVLGKKLEAICAHQSQTTHLINDDPDGFWLSPGMIAHFERPFESYIAPFSFATSQGSSDRPAFER